MLFGGFGMRVNIERYLCECICAEARQVSRSEKEEAPSEKQQERPLMLKPACYVLGRMFSHGQLCAM